jgi:MSHA biogenesis protein MshM
MYRQHFGLRYSPLSKTHTELWDDGHLQPLAERFQWLLDSPGVGLLTGEAGVGKTAALHRLTTALNPHRYQAIYLSETEFGRIDIYRSLAQAFGLEPAYRRSQLWRDLKAHIQDMVDNKQRLPVWIIDAAQNLPIDFFRDFSSFLASLLERMPYAALSSRIQVRVQLKPVQERERFALLIAHALKTAGCNHTLISEPGLELLRQASKGLPRQIGRILRMGLQMAAAKGINHLPDEVLQQAIEEVR